MRNNSVNVALIFIPLAVVASQKCQVAQNSQKIWTYSSSRSSKVDDFGTYRKRICEFLLVINSNFGPILHRFCDTAIYWLKIAIFLPHCHLTPRSPDVPFGSSRWILPHGNWSHGAILQWRPHYRSMSLFDKIPCVWQADIPTDRRTDRWTDISTTAFCKGQK